MIVTVKTATNKTYSWFSYIRLVMKNCWEDQLAGSTLLPKYVDVAEKYSMAPSVGRSSTRNMEIHDIWILSQIA